MSLNNNLQNRAPSKILCFTFFNLFFGQKEVHLLRGGSQTENIMRSFSVAPSASGLEVGLLSGEGLCWPASLCDGEAANGVPDPVAVRARRRGEQALVCAWASVALASRTVQRTEQALHAAQKNFYRVPTPRQCEAPDPH